MGGQQAGERNGGGKSERQGNGRDARATGEHELQHIGGLRAERDADADFPGALTGGESRHAVHSQRG
jgi:hypothetical protein